MSLEHHGLGCDRLPSIAAFPGGRSWNSRPISFLPYYRDLSIAILCSTGILSVSSSAFRGEQLFRPGYVKALPHAERPLASIILVVLRRRKAYQLRMPLLTMQRAGAHLNSLFSRIVSWQEPASSNPRAYRASLRCFRSGEPQWWQAPLLRATDLELWVRTNAMTTEPTPRSPRPARVLPV